ncbi:PREDICTED: alanine aminotransferase 1-like [Amphimedon queenslandica]|uniref:alanine transaminase n=1 Tax=Amphimedon queenslandica TaxID=400682 RepID=A0A1X7VEE3_AMPQE|nr:PREDICTED: alanine aminotransferase 1-like [Amphimedon queenslandica]|eukprot:XP_019849331.1 PREDICTED: alanine aminotransferase 1-like [Amphimedon queenslandica]
MIGASVTRGISLTRSLLSRNWLEMAGTKAAYTTVSPPHMQREVPLTIQNLNPCIREMEYAVRGAVPLEALRIANELKQGVKYPFKEVVFANIGDCQGTGQKPLTFVRQLIACTADTSLLDKGIYPPDVCERARAILADCGGASLGSYTDSRGITIIRKHVQEFITARDGIPANYESIFLTNGATDGIKAAIALCLMEDKKAGVMIPIPQYPLYSAAITELNAHAINYYLDEDNDWSIRMEELERSLEESIKENKSKPKILVVINPGNPTGQCLPEDNMKEIIKFCHRNSLLLLADEVYQENVYVESRNFSSFRKVLLEMGKDYKDFQLMSFNSTSKGFIGECGIRGGYVEMIGFPEDLLQQVYKVFSVRLCANSIGQVVVDVMVKPPQKGDPSFELFDEERQFILQSLKRKSVMVYEKFNSIPGIKCNRLQGSMYAFPQIEIPEGALKDAHKEDPNMTLDTFYCLELLRQEGICFVPGTGFGQRPGTLHIRTTILPKEDVLGRVLERFESFHKKFTAKYQ